MTLDSFSFEVANGAVIPNYGPFIWYCFGYAMGVLSMMLYRRNRV